MMPSRIIALGLGATMLVKNPTLMQQPWMHAKLGAVFLLLGYHARASWTRKKFAAGEYVSRKTAAANHANSANTTRLTHEYILL